MPKKYKPNPFKSPYDDLPKEAKIIAVYPDKITDWTTMDRHMRIDYVIEKWVNRLGEHTRTRIKLVGFNRYLSDKEAKEILEQIRENLVYWKFIK